MTDAETAVAPEVKDEATVETAAAPASEAPVTNADVKALNDQKAAETEIGVTGPAAEEAPVVTPKNNASTNSTTANLAEDKAADKEAANDIEGAPQVNRVDNIEEEAPGFKKRKDNKGQEIVDDLIETGEDYANMMQDTLTENQRRLLEVFNKQWGVAKIHGNMYELVSEAKEITTKYGDAVAMTLVNGHTINYYKNFGGTGGFIGKSGDFEFDQTDANAIIATAVSAGWHMRGGQQRPLPLKGPVEHKAMMWLAAQMYDPPILVDYQPMPGHPVYQQLAELQKSQMTGLGIAADAPPAAPLPKDKTHIDPEVDAILERDIALLRGLNGVWPDGMPHTYDSVEKTIDVLDVFQTTLGNGTANMDAAAQKELIEAYQANPTRLDGVVEMWASKSGLDMEQEIAKLKAPAANADDLKIDTGVATALAAEIEKYAAAGNTDIAEKLAIIGGTMATGESQMTKADQREFMKNWSEDLDDQASCFNYWEEISGIKLDDAVAHVKNEKWFEAEIANVKNGQDGEALAASLQTLRETPNLSIADKKAFTEKYDTEGPEAAAVWLKSKVPAPAAAEATTEAPAATAPEATAPAESKPVVEGSKIAAGPKKPQSTPQMKTWFEETMSAHIAKGETQQAAQLKVMADTFESGKLDFAGAKKVYNAYNYNGGINSAVKDFEKITKISVSKQLEKDDNKPNAPTAPKAATM